MFNSDLTSRIRHIFLHQRPYVSLMTAAQLLGWSLPQMCAAIARREIDVLKTKLATWSGARSSSKALDLCPLDVIEDVLGDDAPRALPEAMRTCELRARVPSYQVAMLEHIAEQGTTTVSSPSSQKFHRTSGTRVFVPG